MATHTKTVSLTDLQQTILSNDLYNDTDNAGLDNWIQEAVDGKINNCWKRFRQEWTQKLMDDESFTDSIPSNQADFVALVTARSDYKNRKARDDAEKGGPYIASWTVDGLAKPTDEQIASYETAGNTEESNNTVRATRKAAYGDIGDQLDEIYKDMDAWKARIKAIKDANPKG
jgi:hypothetical protein